MHMIRLSVLTVALLLSGCSAKKTVDDKTGDGKPGDTHETIVVEKTPLELAQEFEKDPEAAKKRYIRDPKNPNNGIPVVKMTGKVVNVMNGKINEVRLETGVKNIKVVLLADKVKGNTKNAGAT